ncbi:MAG: AbrB/MazE/SpoVT family DNA-binding domain-containing protein [Candidatus Nanohaloarchaea archaeon]
MSTFTGKTFSARLDSKGRVTVPAELRNSLGIEPGDTVQLSLDATNIQVFDVETALEAVEVVEGLEEVRRFDFDGNVLKVVLDG